MVVNILDSANRNNQQETQLGLKETNQICRDSWVALPCFIVICEMLKSLSILVTQPQVMPSIIHWLELPVVFPSGRPSSNSTNSLKQLEHVERVILSVCLSTTGTPQSSFLCAKLNNISGEDKTYQYDNVSDSLLV